MKPPSLRLLLLPFSILYSGILRLRNYLFDTGMWKVNTFPVPVICIGNLSMGGTGKTPHTEYLIRLLGSQFKLATLSRGYGRSTSGFRYVTPLSLASESGDEPLQFAKKFSPSLIVAVDENRKEGIDRLLTDHPEADVVLLDDAFQHRQVQAGLSILLTDYTRPYYADFVLPAGNLREPRSGARRADVVIVTKCPDHLPSEEKAEICLRIGKPHVFFSTIRYEGLVGIMDKQEKAFPGEEGGVLLVTGIANSTPLQSWIRSKVSTLKVMDFPDHHAYVEEDLLKMRKVFEAMSKKNNIIVTTEKDAMRLNQPNFINLIQDLPFYYVPIHVEISDPDRFQQCIYRYVDENKKRS
jgi:tetraacyldisaccharide 4'-kinase